MDSEKKELYRSTADYNLLLYRYLDGWMNDETNAAALDANGNIYLTGFSESEAFMGTLNTGDGLAYAAKLSPSGEVLFATFIPGTLNGTGIAVDAECNIYITGTTNGNLPVTPGAYQESYLGEECGFIVKLDASGDQILYASYFGSAAGTVTPLAIALDENGNVLITGVTRAANYPAETLWPDGRGSANGFVLKLNLNGGGAADLVYGYTIGANSPADSETLGCSIKTQANGRCYIVGQTTASNFRTTPGAIRSVYEGDSEGFIIQLSPSGALEYSTYFGGNKADAVTDIAFDAEHNLYVTGMTTSEGLATPGAAREYGYGSFAAKLTSTEKLYDLSYFTYLDLSIEGPLEEPLRATSDEFVTKYVYTAMIVDLKPGVNHIAVDQTGCAYVSGNTSEISIPIPVSGNIFRTAAAIPLSVPAEERQVDAYVTKFSFDGSSVLYSTYLGGITERVGTDSHATITIDPLNPLNIIITIFTTYFDLSQNVTALAVTPSGNIFIAGSISVALPSVTEGFYNGHTLNGGYVMKLGDAPPVWPDDKNLSVSVMDASTLKLDWTPAGTGTQYYRIYRENQVLATVTQDTLTYTVTDAPSTSSYYYKVEAGNAAGSFTGDGPRCLSDYPLGLSSCLEDEIYAVFDPLSMKRLFPLFIKGNDEMIAPDHKTAVIVDVGENLLKQVDMSSFTLKSETPLGSPTACQIAGITPDSRYALLNAEDGAPPVRSIQSFDLPNDQMAYSLPLPGFILAVSPNGNNLVLVRLIEETGLRLYEIDAQGRLSDTGQKVVMPFYVTSAAFSKDGRYAFGTAGNDADLNSFADKVFSLKVASPDNTVVTSYANRTSGKNQTLISSDGAKIYFGELTGFQIYAFDFLTETIAFEASVPIPYAFVPPTLASNHFMDLSPDENSLFIPYYNNPENTLSPANNTRIFDMTGRAAYEIPDSLGPIDVVIRPEFRSEQQAPVWPQDSSLTASDVTTHSLTLHWTPAFDPKGVTGYRVYKDNAPIADISGNVTELAVSGLAPNTLYHFKVEAWNSDGLITFYGPETEVRTLSDTNRIIASITIIRI